MKTADKIDIIPNAASRRGLSTRTAVVSPDPQQSAEQASDKNAIRPFYVDLHKRGANAP
ncbi:MAG: hypothetical protein ACLQVY_26940 [Limisphaerales bacterium]